MINTIINIANQAGLIHLKHYNCDHEVIHKKGDKYDHLTEADLESDRYIRRELQRLFPDDGILTEESEEVNLDYSKRVWMVDPLDGTKEFTARNDAFSIMIGLCICGIPVLGVVYAPIREELYWAQKSKGAFMIKDNKKKKLKVSSISCLKDARLITRNPHGENRPLDKIVDNIIVKEKIPEGSVGLKLSRIAAQDADVHINTNFRCSKWDTCAPQIILEEAGGRLTDLDGKDLDYKKEGLKWERSFVGTNSLLHDECLLNIENILNEKD